MADRSITPDASGHVPVLLAPVVAALAPAGGVIVDGTFGAGGYARALLAAGAAQVIGIDRDPAALAAAAGWARAEPRLTLVGGVFSGLDEIARAEARGPVTGVVLDIGVSSMQLDQGARGFSFLRDGPLDMRMSGDGVTAAEVIARASEADLADIIYHYGEDRAARRIAKTIVEARRDGPVETTLHLAEIVASCLPRPRPGQVHPATRTFQALRIAVNDELGELVRALSAAERLLGPGGRLAVVTFHSLEDRIVKRFFQIGAATSAGGSRYGPDRRMPPPRWQKPAKPVEATAEEVAANPRARSARLRWAVRTEAPVVDVDPRCLGLPSAPLARTIAGADR